jgi:peptide deformylase
MILPIYVYGSDVLKKRADEVEVDKEDGLQQLIEDMYNTMKEADGVGIAAPQVGKSLRIVIVDGSGFDEEDMPELKGFKRVMINPEITGESEETVEYEEGCLSLPNIHANVIRPKKITVKYLDKEYKEVTEEFDGFGCRMVQHEIDHLEGHVFTDKVSQIRKKMLQSKLNNIASGKVRARYKIKLEK